MNALESGPNDFKLITPSKYIVGKVVGSNCYELELPIRISTIPVVDTCLVLLLLLLLLWGSVVADSGDPLSAWLQLLALVWSEAAQEGEGRNATGRSTVSEVCNKSSYFRYTAECDGDGDRSCRHHSQAAQEEHYCTCVKMSFCSLFSQLSEEISLWRRQWGTLPRHSEQLNTFPPASVPIHWMTFGEDLVKCIGCKLQMSILYWIKKFGCVWLWWLRFIFAGKIFNEKLLNLNNLRTNPELRFWTQYWVAVDNLSCHHSPHRSWVRRSPSRRPRQLRRTSPPARPRLLPWITDTQLPWLIRHSRVSQDVSLNSNHVLIKLHFILHISVNIVLSC